MEHDWNARGDLAQEARMTDWLESQLTVLNFWKERLLDNADVQQLHVIEEHELSLQKLIIKMR